MYTYIWYAEVTFIYQALFYLWSHSSTVLQQLVYDDGQMPSVCYFSDCHYNDTQSHIYMQLLGFLSMKPFTYVHSALSLMLLLLTVIFFLFLYLHSFIINLSSWGLRVMARHARQNVMTPKNFLERKHFIYQVVPKL